MTSSDDGNDDDSLRRPVARRRRERARWRREGERPLARNLALIGALGWLVVLPLLAGVLLGRWLDRLLERGVTFTLGLTFLGVVLGCWLAWKRIERE